MTAPRHHKKRSRRRGLTEWLIVLVVAVLASFLVRTYVVQTYFIPSKSMKPTLYVGNRIMVDKLAVEFGHINIGDIVVFKAPARSRPSAATTFADLVKRVIGLPGDVLTSKGNTIYVNGVALDEKWSHYEPLGPPYRSRHRTPGPVLHDGRQSRELL